MRSYRRQDLTTDQLLEEAEAEHCYPFESLFDPTMQDYYAGVNEGYGDLWEDIEISCSDLGIPWQCPETIPRFPSTTSWLPSLVLYAQALMQFVSVEIRISGGFSEGAGISGGAPLPEASHFQLRVFCGPCGYPSWGSWVIPCLWEKEQAKEAILRALGKLAGCSCGWEEKARAIDPELIHTMGQLLLLEHPEFSKG